MRRSSGVPMTRVSFTPAPSLVAIPRTDLMTTRPRASGRAEGLVVRGIASLLLVWVMEMPPRSEHCKDAAHVA